ncbi:uncharacterized protein DUF946 [Roseibium hamelinense]|uniref:Uncharacterized protein DUF946 n=1 Tax=Roseibium hamelinense TaxID=150831 RepID=A0A562TA24_9HYPH|nr:Vps62-related protein [Roseibium hamelinense]TWI90455.1 uncharacterized protein DUF946 [Roseibium hamelinense]
MTDAALIVDHSETQTENAPFLPGSPALGFGYDVNGEYAEPESILDGALFDFPDETKPVNIGGQDYIINKLFNHHMIERSDYYEVFGNTIDIYRESQNHEISVEGKYKLFSGSLSTSFSSKSLSQEETTYSTIRQIHKLWSVNLPRTSDILQYLKPSVAAEINNKSISPNKIFDKYGAVFLGEVIVGGRIDSNSATKSLKVDRSMDIRVVAKASYQALIGEIHVKSDSHLAKEIESYRANSELSHHVIGGDQQYVSAIFKGDTEAYAAWAKSLSDRAVMMDFTKEGLRPIWELATESTRRSELENAFADWVLSKETKIVKDKTVLALNQFPAMQNVGTDSGSGAKMDLSVWRPVIAEHDSYFYGGQWGQHNHNPTADGRAAVFRDLEDLGLLKEPVSFIKIWDDAGSGKSHDYSCWRPAPPQGYRALGDFMVLRESSGHFPDHLAYKVMCVHESLCRDVTQDDFGSSYMWQDHGTHANKDLSLWRLEPASTTGGVNVGSFIGSPYENSIPHSVIDGLRGVVGVLKDDFIKAYKNPLHLVR